MNIVSPFLSIVSGLLSQVGDFVAPIILGAISSGPGGDKNSFPSIISMNNVIDYVRGYLGIEDDDNTKAGPFTIISGVFTFVGLFLSLIGLKGKAPWAGKTGLGRFNSPVGGVIISFFGCLFCICGLLSGISIPIQFAMIITGIALSILGYGISLWNLYDSIGADKILCIGGIVVGAGGALSGGASMSEIQ